MKEYNKRFVSKCDGLMLDCVITEPESIKAIFLIAHGMAEHKERYLDFMRYLTQNGYFCICHDHRGHGKSIKEENDLGYFYDLSGEYIVEDIHDIGMYYKKKYNVPFYLFGHSMGSLLVRNVIKKYDADIDKLIVCGSPSANPAIKFAINLTKTMIKLKGDRHISYFINDLALGGYQKKFHEDVKNTWLSVNRENVENYNNDPLCGFVFTLNGFLNLFLNIENVYSLKNWSMKHKNLPILFIAGEFDPCIESFDKWKEAQKYLTDVGYINITSHLYANMRHEILLEDEHMNVYQDVLKFISK